MSIVTLVVVDGGSKIRIRTKYLQVTKKSLTTVAVKRVIDNSNSNILSFMVVITILGVLNDVCIIIPVLLLRYDIDGCRR